MGVPLSSEMGDEGGQCTDGYGGSCPEICCYDGGRISGCCPYATPSCDLVHRQCLPAFGDGFVNMSEVESSMDIVPLSLEVNNEGGACGDGYGGSCPEICCYGGDRIAGCCPYAYPLCDSVHGKCLPASGEGFVNMSKIEDSTEIVPNNLIVYDRCDAVWIF